MIQLHIPLNSTLGIKQQNIAWIDGHLSRLNQCWSEYYELLLSVSKATIDQLTIVLPHTNTDHLKYSEVW